MSYLSRLAGNIIVLMEALAGFRSNTSVDVHPDSEQYLAGKKSCIFIFWHHNIPLTLYTFRDRGFIPMISLSGDAGLLIPTLKYFGYGFIRGSSTRGGLYALKEGEKLLKRGKSLAITPDGPVGPRYSFKPGAYYFSRNAGVPVISVGVSLYKRIVIGSWDGLEIPKPYSISAFVLAEPYFCKEDKVSEIRRMKERLHETEYQAELKLKKRLRAIYR